jgi:hypothetical protein
MVRDLALSDPTIKYEKHLNEKKTAEASMAFAAEKATSEYVWVFGDDDEPCQGSLKMIIQELNRYADFYLLNSLIRTPEKNIVPYLSQKKEPKEFKQGKKLWLEYGFASATTTLSSLCFKRALFDLDIFKRFEKVSEIYSHSVSLFAMFFRGKARFISEPLYIYSAPPNELYAKEFSCFLKNKGLPFQYPFSAGLLRLLIIASSHTSIPLKELIHAKEVEIRKDNWRLFEQTTGSFMMRFAQQRLSTLRKTPQRGLNNYDFQILLCYLVLKFFRIRN